MTDARTQAYSRHLTELSLHHGDVSTHFIAHIPPGADRQGPGFIFAPSPALLRVPWVVSSLCSGLIFLTQSL